MTNADTAILVAPSNFARNLSYQATSTEYAYIWKRTAFSRPSAGTIFFQRGRLSLDQTNSRGAGFVVRYESFPHLLSGSYGLAEGTGTKMDTAVLTIGLVRSGWYVFDITYLRIIGEGMIWTRIHTRYNATNIYFSERTLSPNSDYNPAHGMSVRCTGLFR